MNIEEKIANIFWAHALKVLDLMNIKCLPTQYILKQWTRQAQIRPKGKKCN
jgi:hypothetical protein